MSSNSVWADVGNDNPTTLPTEDPLLGLEDFIITHFVTFLVLAALTLLVVFLLRRRKERIGPKDLGQRQFGFTELLCVALTLALVGSDFYAMSNMFTRFDVTDNERIIYSATFALFLEGFPFVLGLVIPQIQDPVQFIKGRKKAYRKIASFCRIGLAVSWVLAIYIRLLQVAPIENGTLTRENFTLSELIASPLWAYLASDYGETMNTEYLAQIFLFLSPVLTSMLCYVISLHAFSKTSVDVAAEKYKRCRERFEWCENRYQKAEERRQDVMASMWRSLCDEEDRRYYSINEFRSACHVLIHDKMIAKCVNAYPGLLKRYNEEIELKLAQYIVRIGKHSTIPERIEKLTVESIVRQYDDKQHDPTNKWNFEECGYDMREELSSLLHEAIILAQFKSESI